MHLFEAFDLRAPPPARAAATDPDEAIAVRTMSMEAALRMARSGEILDMKTVVALLLAGRAR
jgi:hypothetical protein